MDTSKTSSNEIDLEELLLSIILGVKRSFRLIIICLVIGTGLGAAYGALRTKVYESKMLVTSDILTESYVDKFGNNFDDMIREGSPDLLSSQLNIPLEECKKIKSIKIESGKRERTLSESEQTVFFMLITVQLTDQALLPMLQKGIVDYLENIDFVKERVKLRKAFTEEIIKKLDVEIKSLEDFRTASYQGQFAGNKDGVAMDATEVNSKIILLTQQKHNLENILHFPNSVHVVENFTLFHKPKYPRTGISIMTGAGLGILFAVIIIGVQILDKKIKLAEAKQN